MFKFLKTLFSKLATRPPWKSDIEFINPSFVNNAADNISSIFRGVNLISGTTAGLPIKFYRPIQEEKDFNVSTSLNRVLNIAPNPFMDAVTYRELMSTWLVLKGDAYSEKVYDGESLEALFPIHPDRVSVEFENNNLRYKVRQQNGTFREYTKDEIFHIHVWSDDGIKGKSFVKRAKQSLELTYAMESFGLGLFKRGVKPSGIIEHPGELTKDGEDRLRRQFERLYGGPENHHRVIVLEEGTTFKPSAFTPDEAQFLGSRKFQIYEIARWLGIPPHLLYELDHATFSNIEQQSLDYLAYSFRYWLTKWIAAIKRQLISPFEDIWPEFDTEPLIQLDTNTKYTTAKMSRDGGWKNANEIRSSFGMRNIGPKGDIYLYPMNYMNAETFMMNGNERKPSPNPTPPVESEPNESNSFSFGLHQLFDPDNREPYTRMPKMQGKGLNNNHQTNGHFGY